MSLNDCNLNESQWKRHRAILLRVLPPEQIAKYEAACEQAELLSTLEEKRKILQDMLMLVAREIDRIYAFKLGGEEEVSVA